MLPALYIQSETPLQKKGAFFWPEVQLPVAIQKAFKQATKDTEGRR